MSNKKFPFRDRPDTACITCSHITDEKMPILYAAHDDDGWWQFLCGAPGHDQKSARIVSLLSIVDSDETVAEIAGMAANKKAERGSVKEKWIIEDYS